MLNKSVIDILNGYLYNDITNIIDDYIMNVYYIDVRDKQIIEDIDYEVKYYRYKNNKSKSKIITIGNYYFKVKKKVETDNIKLYKLYLTNSLYGNVKNCYVKRYYLICKYNHVYSVNFERHYMGKLEKQSCPLCAKNNYITQFYEYLVKYYKTDIVYNVNICNISSLRKNYVIDLWCESKKVGFIFGNKKINDTINNKLISEGITITKILKKDCKNFNTILEPKILNTVKYLKNEKDKLKKVLSKEIEYIKKEFEIRTNTTNENYNKKIKLINDRIMQLEQKIVKTI